MSSPPRTLFRGMVLIEMLVYILLVFAIIGVMSAMVFISAQSLRKRAERELNDDRWLTLVQQLRDDLRSARKVHWKKPVPKGQPKVLLSMARSDGSEIEVLHEQQRLVRRVTGKTGKKVETLLAQMKH